MHQQARKRQLPQLRRRHGSGSGPSSQQTALCPLLHLALRRKMASLLGLRPVMCLAQMQHLVQSRQVMALVPGQQAAQMVASAAHLIRDVARIAVGEARVAAAVVKARTHPPTHLSRYETTHVCEGRHIAAALCFACLHSFRVQNAAAQVRRLSIRESHLLSGRQICPTSCPLCSAGHP